MVRNLMGELHLQLFKNQMAPPIIQSLERQVDEQENVVLAKRMIFKALDW